MFALLRWQGPERQEKGIRLKPDPWLLEGWSVAVVGSATNPELGSALAVIRRAIHNELAGQRFYNDASFYCIDPWAKDIFASIAREEEKHTQLLLVEYNALETRGRWVEPDRALDRASGVDITSLTFSDDEPAEDLFPSQQAMSEAVDRRADDLAALELGIRMEQEAVVLYGGEITGTQDPAAVEAYRFLVEEETRHYHQFREQWERLAGRPFLGPYLESSSGRTARSGKKE